MSKKNYQLSFDDYSASPETENGWHAMYHAVKQDLEAERKASASLRWQLEEAEQTIHDMEQSLASNNRGAFASAAVRSNLSEAEEIIGRQQDQISVLSKRSDDSDRQLMLMRKREASLLDEQSSMQMRLRNAQDALQIAQQDLQSERDHYKKMTRSTGNVMIVMLIVFSLVCTGLIRQLNKVKTSSAESIAFQQDEIDDLRSEISAQYDEGFDLGKEQGRTEGYDEGLRDAQQSGFQSYQAGFDDGKEIGYKEGFSDGKASEPSAIGLNREEARQDTSAQEQTIFDRARAKEQAQVAASQTRTASETVYITKTGDCYHRENCYHLKSKIEVTKEEAIAKGLQPCSDCHP